MTKLFQAYISENTDRVSGLQIILSLCIQSKNTASNFFHIFYPQKIQNRFRTTNITKKHDVITILILTAVFEQEQNLLFLNKNLDLI